MSSILGGINIITSILNLRARGMTCEDAAVRVDLADHRLPAAGVMPVLAGRRFT